MAMTGGNFAGNWTCTYTHIKGQVIDPAVRFTIPATYPLPYKKAIELSVKHSGNIHQIEDAILIINSDDQSASLSASWNNTPPYKISAVSLDAGLTGTIIRQYFAEGPPDPDDVGTFTGVKGFGSDEQG